MENGKKEIAVSNAYHDFLYHIIYGCFCLIHLEMEFSQTIKSLTDTYI